MKDKGFMEYKTIKIEYHILIKKTTLHSEHADFVLQQIQFNTGGCFLFSAKRKRK